MSAALKAERAAATVAVTSGTTTRGIFVPALDMVPTLLENRDIVLVTIRKPGTVDILERVFNRLGDQLRDDEEVALSILSRVPSLSR
jgi:hypothetical protein